MNEVLWLENTAADLHVTHETKEKPRRSIHEGSVYNLICYITIALHWSVMLVCQIAVAIGPYNRKTECISPADQCWILGYYLFWVGHFFLIKPSRLESPWRNGDVVNSIQFGWMS